jgi:hydrogenase maturation protein HypF
MAYYKKMAQKNFSNSSKLKKTETYLIAITGIVQGVGFRPFIWLAAEKLMLSGSVANTTGGVIIKVNSISEEIVLKFTEYIKKNKPAAALIENITYSHIPFEEFKGFNIEKSYNIKNTFTFVSPDIATCDKCIRDINDYKNSRRFNYPFTNCTNCGPRFTIIENMPYDRLNTTMKRFIQCPECSAEYIDPSDRRFHAQPNACKICGPELKLINSYGMTIKTDDPIVETAKLLHQGFIVGIKSLGGFQLACDATNNTTVAELRKRKTRPAKPFALMLKDTSAISEMYNLSNKEKESLNSTAAPILLLKKKEQGLFGRLNQKISCKLTPEESFGIKNEQSSGAVHKLSFGVSFNNRYEGVMLPYTPLHHLLFKYINNPLVMTSGNISEEPIAYENSDAVNRLGKICDYFLLNDRDIFSRYDDSVLRIFDGKEMIARRARGFAPYPIKTDTDIGKNIVLAVGAQEKNTFCLYTSNYAIVSQHIGDLEAALSNDFFMQTLKNYKKIFGIKKIDIIISDMHPDYFSTKFAKEYSKASKKIQLQHHEAHIASVIAENHLIKALTATGPGCLNHENTKSIKRAKKNSITAIGTDLSGKKDLNEEVILGFAWDGTGYGYDGKIWGSEILTVDGSFNFNRLGSLREKYIPGGEITIKKPYRMALSYLYEIWKAGITKNNLLPPNQGLSGKTDKKIQTPVAKGVQIPGSSIDAETAGSDDNAAGYNIKNTGFAEYIFKNFPFYKDISSKNEITILKSQIETGFNSPATTSMGRFFDAVSSLLDIAHVVSYEGEAAIKLEMAADLHCNMEYDLSYLGRPGFYENNPFVFDDYQILFQILKDIKNKVDPVIISAKFHNSLARAILLISLELQKKLNIKYIALSGGVFQNNFLLGKSFKLLKKHGFKPYSNFKVPVNDGGISLGQAYYGAWKINRNDNKE